MKMLNIAFMALFSLCALVPVNNLSATWSTPVTLSSLGVNSETPDVAVNSTGNAIAAWSEFNGTVKVIRTASLPSGGSWSSTVDLSNPSVADSYNPYVTANSAGNAIVCWEAFENDQFHIEVSTRQFGGTWSDYEIVSGEGYDATTSQAAIDSTGNLTVVWQRSNGDNTVIQATRLPLGGEWSTYETISTEGQDSYNAQITTNASGKVVAHWTSFDGSNLVIQAATFTAGGGWTTPTTLSASGQDAMMPEVAINNNGDVIMVWTRFDGANFIIQSSTLTFGGSWSSPVDLTVTGLDAYLPQVAIDPSGNAAAVWMGSDGTNYVISASSLPFGDSWSTPTVISASGQDATNPVVGVDSSGNAVASWTRLDGSNFILQVATLPYGGSWSSVSDLSGIGQDAISARIAVDPSGNAVVAWMRNGANYIIQSSSGTSLF